ncbi:hypothetical protein T12_8198 [Trichinella patagoniensis]|uniref:Uncharacterized protein n=1 Tax=Trichinella patagoniensis TaxID=990121 RepID=A0A0V1A8P8_9BILA|nr:hypothetical protein T12_8198 [Trichinella patagoniensis]
MIPDFCVRAYTLPNAARAQNNRNRGSLVSPFRIASQGLPSRRLGHCEIVSSGRKEAVLNSSRRQVDLFPFGTDSLDPSAALDNRTCSWSNHKNTGGSATKPLFASTFRPTGLALSPFLAESDQNLSR